MATIPPPSRAAVAPSPDHTHSQPNHNNYWLPVWSRTPHVFTSWHTLECVAAEGFLPADCSSVNVLGATLLLLSAWPMDPVDMQKMKEWKAQLKPYYHNINQMYIYDCSYFSRALIRDLLFCLLSIVLLIPTLLTCVVLVCLSSANLDKWEDDVLPSLLQLFATGAGWVPSITSSFQHPP